MSSKYVGTGVLVVCALIRRRRNDVLSTQT
jgi:hypothetical protein